MDTAFSIANLSPEMREIVRQIRSINPDLNDLGHAQLAAMEGQKWAMEDEIARLKIENGKLIRKIYGLLPS